MTDVPASPETKANILVFCNDLDYFRRHRLAVAQALALKANVVVVVGGSIPEAGHQDGVTYIHVSIERFFFRPLQDMRLVLLTLALLRRYRPVAVHLITLKPAVYCGIAAVLSAWLRVRPQRLVLTIPGLGRLMSPGEAQITGWKADLSRRIVSGVIRLLSTRTWAHFTFETEYDRDTWLKAGLVHGNNTTVLRGAGVDGNAYFPGPRAEAGPPSPIRVLFASRLLKAKGLEAFLLAARLCKPAEDIRFQVAGIIAAEDPDGISASDLAANPEIEFLGEVRDMPRLLQEVDLICLPTLYGEGIPRILIEAAACGLPAIASDTPGCSEIIDDGRTGMLVPVAPTAKMASNIADCIKTYRDRPDLWRVHSRQARARFLAGGFQQYEIISEFVRLIAGTSESPRV